MYVHRIRHAILALLAAASLSISLGAIHAFAAGAPNDTVGMRPSDAAGKPIGGPGYWVIKSAPGSVAHLHALITNSGHSAALVSVIPVDAVNGAYGGITYKTPDKPQIEVGAWTSVPENRVRVDPGKAVVVPFSVHVPAGARPGQHVGSLTAFIPATASKGGKFTAITVQFRSFDAIVIDVPGPATHTMTIGGVRQASYRPDSAYVLMHLRNTGNTMVQGHGTIHVTQEGQSRPLVSGPFSFDKTLPGSSLDYPVRWVQNPPPGTYHAWISLTWSGGHKTWSGAFEVAAPSSSSPTSKIRTAPIGSAGAPVTSRSAPFGLVILLATLLVVALGVVCFLLFQRRREAGRTA